MNEWTNERMNGYCVSYTNSTGTYLIKVPSFPSMAVLCCGRASGRWVHFFWVCYGCCLTRSRQKPRHLLTDRPLPMSWRSIVAPLFWLFKNFIEFVVLLCHLLIRSKNLAMKRSWIWWFYSIRSFMMWWVHGLVRLSLFLWWLLFILRNSKKMSKSCIFL